MSVAQERKALSSERAVQVCASHLREILRMLKLYVHHTGGAVGFPKDLETLSTMGKDATLFVCPADKGLRIEGGQKESSFQSSYEIPNGTVDLMTKKPEASLVAVVVERRRSHTGRRHVLFYDGTVQLMNDREFNELKKNGFVRVVGQVGAPSSAKVDRKPGNKDALDQELDSPSGAP
jgi:hypothetical protein